MTFWMYRFRPHRPDLPVTMTDDEAAVMADHVAYWQSLADQRTAVAFGPVADPSGAWGAAIVEAGTQSEVETIRAADPVVLADLGLIDIHPMPGAITRT